MIGYSNSVRSRNVQPCSRDKFMEIVQSSRVGDICAQLKDLHEALLRGDISEEDYKTKKKELKDKLPMFTFHATYVNGRRLNAEAVPSGLAMLDLDHVSDPYTLGPDILAQLADKAMLCLLALMHVTPSCQGLRLVFATGNADSQSLAQTQAMLSEILGVECDRAVKDMARCSFAVPQDYILYQNDALLFAPSAAQAAHSAFAAAVQEYQAQQQKTPQADSHPAAGATALPPVPFAPDSTKQFKGVPYTDIISEWFILNGGEPQPGERNATLHKLACALKHITDSDEALLLAVMPRYGLDEAEMRSLIKNAAKSEGKWMPRQLREAIRTAQDRALAEQLTGAEDGCPPMPKTLPPVVKLLLLATPECYRECVAHAIFPPMGAHLHRVYFPYIDNKKHEATLMCVLMAGTGAGKDCISDPIDFIMADIRERDAANLKREKEWKEDTVTRGANKDKKKRPEGLVIQEIDADLTNPALVMRLSEADGHFLYAKLNELDQFDALRGTSSVGQQFQIMCLAFDPNNRYGQTRVGAGSVTEKVQVRWNWNAATTVTKGKRYFAKVLTDGPLSRINFCTIPAREIGADMPVYGTYPDDYAEQLKPYIQNLTSCQGTVRCEEALKFMLTLREECAEHSRLSQNRVYENFTFRALVIAYLKAMVLYVAQGKQWSKEIERFVRWSLRYDLWCKMYFFGEDIARQEGLDDDADNTQKARRGPKNLLLLLPDVFTESEAAAARAKVGLNPQGAKNMLSTWVARGYVEKTADGGGENSTVQLYSYRKLKYTSQKPVNSDSVNNDAPDTANGVEKNGTSGNKEQ